MDFRTVLKFWRGRQGAAPVVSEPAAAAAADNADVAELAAAITALDFVITVDTTVVHLAGALRRPVWVLLPFAPEWRYPRSSDTMPWYPSARLFRQPRPREWKPVLAEAAVALWQLRDARGV